MTHVEYEKSTEAEDQSAGKKIHPTHASFGGASRSRGGMWHSLFCGGSQKSFHDDSIGKDVTYSNVLQGRV